MRLVRLHIENYRSIKSIDTLRVEPLQALVGENNAGKSNIIRALDCFLSSGAGALEASDFHDPSVSIVIEAEFGELNDTERRRLRSYLIGGRLILQKRLAISMDERSGKRKIAAEYHGYRAEPRNWWLSVQKVLESKGQRPNWATVAEDNGLSDYVRDQNGKVTKASYEAGLANYLLEHEDVRYDEPELGNTQALGLQQNLLSALPALYILPAITDYSDEIDRRSSSTVFRRLMSDLSDRLLKSDPRYVEIEAALERLKSLFNLPLQGEEPKRLESLGDVETALLKTIKGLMPSVRRVQLSVEFDQSRDMFARGVSIRVDDGALTDVLTKGHGMQRSIVFALLQMLIQAGRQSGEVKPIILAIEEPELYIHPHAQRLIFGVLKDFAGVSDTNEDADGTDQVIYTTHSPAFVDVSHYERIGIVKKQPDAGTVVSQCSRNALGNATDKKVFKTITCFGLRHNELFFARHCILVEGPEDEIAVIAGARKLGRIRELPDEIGLSVVVTDGKGEIPKFQRILNAFNISYSVLIELDGKPETDTQSAAIISELRGSSTFKLPKRLEDFLGLGRHFADQREAKVYFSDMANVTPDVEDMVVALLPVARVP